MKKYLVGGAVRDRLLKFPVTERDWVVVGETLETMTSLGYRSVGKDFPVFLHPDTHEEYALARTERKISPGYTGFSIHASSDISLEQDLLRRDLTINAMAEDDSGNLTDPFNGQRDLEDRLLRHVSPAFSEDPVRILRVARFAARYAHLGFKVANETQDLMKKMVACGEVDALVAERVWVELEKTLGEQSPWVFFQVLRDCNALVCLFPEIDRLFGVPQPARYHPEIDTGIHTLMVLEQAAKLSKKPVVRFAALTHDLGKGLTPSENWPSHRGHEKIGIEALEALCDRLKAPKAYRKLAEKVMRFHTHCHRAMELKPATLVDTLYQLDTLRQPESLEDFLLACKADMQGRTGFEDRLYPQEKYFQDAQKAVNAITVDDIKTPNLKGKEIGQELRILRIDSVRKLLQNLR